MYHLHELWYFRNQLIDCCSECWSLLRLCERIRCTYPEGRDKYTSWSDCCSCTGARPTTVSPSRSGSVHPGGDGWPAASGWWRSSVSGSFRSGWRRSAGSPQFPPPSTIRPVFVLTSFRWSHGCFLSPEAEFLLPNWISPDGGKKNIIFLNLIQYSSSECELFWESINFDILTGWRDLVFIHFLISLYQQRRCFYKLLPQLCLSYEDTNTSRLLLVLIASREIKTNCSLSDWWLTQTVRCTASVKWPWNELMQPLSLLFAPLQQQQH